MQLQAGDLITVSMISGPRPARYVRALRGRPVAAGQERPLHGEFHQIRIIYRRFENPANQVLEDLGQPRRMHQDYIAKAPTCRRCGCSDFFACEGGCSWVEPDLCSSCAT